MNTLGDNLRYSFKDILTRRKDLRNSLKAIENLTSYIICFEDILFQ